MEAKQIKKSRNQGQRDEGCAVGGWQAGLGYQPPAPALLLGACPGMGMQNTVKGRRAEVGHS